MAARVTLPRWSTAAFGNTAEQRAAGLTLG